MLCQSFSLPPEYLKLLMVTLIIVLILLGNYCQPLSNMEKLVLAGGIMAFESSTSGSGGEGQLTELIGGCHNLRGNHKVTLLMDNRCFDLGGNWDRLGDVHHVDGEA